MPKPNFYMSDKDRKCLLETISNYIGMWEGEMDEEECDELVRVRDKIRNMKNTKSYNNSIIDEASKVAKEVIDRNENKQGSDIL